MIISNKNDKIKNPSKLPRSKKIKIKTQLNKNYQFNNFIESDGNQFARNVGFFIAENIHKNPFNPLFIYGDVATGKTHLVQAIGNEIKKRFSKKNVLYVSAEVFTQKYIDSVKKNELADFIRLYQLIDILIVEDVQFLAAKSSTQNIFIQIYNYLHQKKKHIIFTSDKAPMEMEDIEQQLLSRFKCGLSVELKKPNKNKHQFLTNFLSYHNVKIPDEIIEYLAQNNDFNIRMLEGFILFIKAEKRFNENEITFEFVKNIFEKIIGEPKTN